MDTIFGELDAVEVGEQTEELKKIEAMTTSHHEIVDEKGAVGVDGSSYKA